MGTGKLWLGAFTLGLFLGVMGTVILVGSFTTRC